MNTYDKYELQRRVDGRLNLPNKTHEAAIHLIANGTDAEDVPTFLPEITSEEVTALLADPLAQRRLEWKRKNLGNEAPKCPTSQEGFYQFALKKLWKLANTADADKDKIAALKVLAEIAGKAPDPKPQPSDDGSEKLSQLLGVK